MLAAQAGIRFFAFRRTEWAEVEIPTADADTGLPRCLVEQIGGNFVPWSCHRATPFREFRGMTTTKSRTLEPHFPARKGVPNSRNRLDLQNSRGERIRTFDLLVPNQAL